jgi:subtilase-type serine protease
MQRAMTAVAALALSACGATTAPPATGPALQFQTIAAPASQFPNTVITAPTGIVSNLVTTTMATSSGGTIGGLYNLTTSTWIPIQFPTAASTAAYGPAVTAAGYRVVGSYKLAGATTDNAYVYDSGTNAYTGIDPPPSYCAPSLCNEAIAHSSYGTTTFQVVGNCDSVANGPGLDVYPATAHAFLYDSASATFSKIGVTGAVSTTAYGIWSDPGEVAVAGGYTDAQGTHAYVRGLTSGMMLTYNYPGALLTHFEGITGAGGPGDYNLAGDIGSISNGTLYGFFLPVRNWVAGTPIPLGLHSANSVYQNTVVGVTTTGVPPLGYIVTVP